MKRIIAYILLAALALNSMGCGKMTAHERKKVVCAKTQYEPGNELECDRLFISREDKNEYYERNSGESRREEVIGALIVLGVMAVAFLLDKATSSAKKQSGNDTAGTARQNQALEDALPSFNQGYIPPSR